MKIKRMLIFVLMFACMGALVGCNEGCGKAIQLMGAGEKIHDTYTFANVGTKIKDDGATTFTIYGSVDKLENQTVKEEFEIAENVTHVVAIKLCGKDETVVKDEVEIYIDGTRNYDAEHLNGSTYTYILLEAKPGVTVSISVKWNKSAEAKTYNVKFDENLEIK